MTDRKKVKKVPVTPVEIGEDGTIKLNLAATLSNVDWLRARRLKIQADAGDEEAKKKLEDNGFNTDGVYNRRRRVAYTELYKIIGMFASFSNKGVGYGNRV